MAHTHAGVHEVLVPRGAMHAEAEVAVGRGRTGSTSAPLQSRARGPVWDTLHSSPSSKMSGHELGKLTPLSELLSPSVRSPT